MSTRDTDVSVMDVTHGGTSAGGRVAMSGGHDRSQG